MNMNSLDLNLIRVFDALMQEKSVTRAGERIGLSQPAVSSALNRLRYALGDQLFVRRGNDMVATPRAEEIAVLARTALASIERMIQPNQNFDPQRLERTFSMLGADFFSMLLMPSLAMRIGAAAPGVRLRLLDMARGDVTRLLQDDAVDVAMLRELDLPDWITSARLFKAPFVIIAGAGNSSVSHLTPGQVFPLDLFCSLPHAMHSFDGSMSGLVDEALAASGHTRRVILALPHFQAVGLAVARGHHIAAVPRQFAEIACRTMDLLVFVPPLHIPVPSIRLYWHARHDGEAAHQWMRNQIIAEVQALGFDTP